jgi:hypothetical protein
MPEYSLSFPRQLPAGLSVRPPASPVRPLCPPDKEISSILEYIQGIFKEYSENMSNTPSSCPVKWAGTHACLPVSLRMPSMTTLFAGQ